MYLCISLEINFSKEFSHPTPANNFLNSLTILSTDTNSINFAFFLIAKKVLSSISKFSFDENRKARNIRSASSKNLSFGLFTV